MQDRGENVEENTTEQVDLRAEFEAALTSAYQEGVTAGSYSILVGVRTLLSEKGAEETLSSIQELIEDIEPTVHPDTIEIVNNIASKGD